LSSTTDQRGQALAIFALSLTTLLIVAALAFDGGAMMLERRDQQGAADAAAIAGARYVLDSPSQAIAAAQNVATANGFTHGISSQSVSVNIPPTSGPHAGDASYVEVLIGTTRPSIFAGIMSIASWPVSARAVATDFDAAGGSFSVLALEPLLCDAMLLSGNGSITAFGNIQVNSECSNGAMRRQGNGDITVDVDSGACNVVGDIQDGGGQGVIDCVQNEGAPYVEDPLADLPDAALPALPTNAVQVSGSLPVPAGCPGATNEATYASPAVCQFPSNYAGTTWRLYPGLYPGGLKLQGGTFYLEPGIYYLGGGGLDITGTGTQTISVDPNGTGAGGAAGGVMFYNTEIPGAPAGPIILNGASAAIDVLPLDDPSSSFAGLVIYQDRAINIDPGDDVTINGSASDMDVRGTIYVPAGEVKVNGSSGTLTLDQVIADTFLVNGAPGSDILALRDNEYIIKLRGAGLVE
jgi:hypothetical protein